MTGKADRIELFVATKGHAFLRDPFEALLRAAGAEPTFVDQPAAAALMNPAAMRRYDAILFYDMPGLDFRAPRDVRPDAPAPPPAMTAGFAALLAEGKGIVALHHALAGWPAWPAYAAALGGAFLYRPRDVRGVATAESGYRAPADYPVRVVDRDHPVTAGLPERFELHDELYWHEVFAGDIHPLIVRDAPADPADYQSACRAVRRLRDGEGPSWQPTAGSATLGWAKQAGNSRLVYLQPGDGPETYAHPVYRQLLGNALRWVARRG